MPKLTQEEFKIKYQNTFDLLNNVAASFSSPRNMDPHDELLQKALKLTGHSPDDFSEDINNMQRRPNMR